MTKFVVVVLPDETKAYEGTRAIKALGAEGSLDLYGIAVIAKEEDGKVSIKQQVDQGPLGLGVGALVGGLVGLLGGPAGVTIGLGGGALLGSLSDLYNLGVSGEFVDKIAQQLTPGTFAVLCEVYEDWVTPLDSHMQALGGIVVREWRFDFEGELAQKEAAARKAELAQLKAEFTHAKEEGKAKLKAQIEEVQKKAHAASDRIESRLSQLGREADAKIKALEQKAAQAKGQAKAKIDQRIVELRADRERRSRQLKQAWDLTKEALKP